MKKNFSVNIGGRVFNIDDDAYERLNGYLTSLRTFFAADQGREEIIADIESRIAELLEMKKTQGFSIITIGHINEVISGMGEPDQLGGMDTDEQKSEPRYKTSGKLFRDPDNRQIGGVAAGIAAWFGINPIWMRILFVAFTFIYGIGAIFYAILWLILPQARTTSERLEMQREIINIGTLRKEITSAGSGLKNTGNSVLHSFGKLLRFFTEVITHVFRLFIKVLRIVSGAMLIFLVLAMFTGLGLAYIIRETMHPGIFHLDYITQTSLLEWLIPGAAVRWLAYIAIIAFVLGIAGMFIYLGLRLIFKWPPLRWQILAVFGLLILAGLVVGGGAIFQYSQSVSETASESKAQTFVQKSDKLHLVVAPDDPNLYWKPLSGTDISKHNQEVLGNINLSIRPAPGDSMIVTIIRGASSYRENTAAEYLRNIEYAFVYQDTLLTLNPYFSIPKSDGMHQQSLELILGIPVKTAVKLDEHMAWKVNFRDFVEESNTGGEYIMTSSGLKLNKP
jgi:phage shock protein PspC (stress-responsive transcriptional regulator)